MTCTTPTFLERASLAKHPVAKKLFTLIHQKQSNLACALDVTDSKTLLALADAIGPEICVLKTHIDILSDFTPSVIPALQELSYKHQFLLFEDRKFADIGNTTLEQYKGGLYKISSWADITNAHILPGPGIIEALKEEGIKQGKALLLLAQMSSKNNFFTPEYTESAITLAKQHSDFVIGFVSQQKLTEIPTFLHFTPGIKEVSSYDHLGQQFSTPQTALAKGSDILIVGRGIYLKENPQKAAAFYRELAWNIKTP